MIDMYKWFGKRELDYIPAHFVRCETPLSEDSRLWVTSRLRGRYAVVQHTDMQTFTIETRYRVYFEDPSEATIYELRWSGSK